MTARVVVIGCGAAKRDLAPGELVPIGELYTGNLFRSRLAYARMFGGPHFVASAHHGLVPVDTLVASYEKDLRLRGGRAEYTERVLRALEKHVDRSIPIIALVAGPYAAPFRVARARGWSVEIPAEGLPIGETLRFLKLQLRGRPITDVEVLAGSDFHAEAQLIEEELERDAPDDDEEWTISTGALRALLARAAARRAA